MSFSENLGSSADNVQTTEAVGEVFRASECCLADVDNVVERIHDQHDWHASRFICKQCGNETRIITNPLIARLETENRQLREQVGNG